MQYFRWRKVLGHSRGFESVCSTPDGGRFSTTIESCGTVSLFWDKNHISDHKEQFIGSEKKKTISVAKDTIFRLWDKDCVSDIDSYSFSNMEVNIMSVIKVTVSWF